MKRWRYIGRCWPLCGQTQTKRTHSSPGADYQSKWVRIIDIVELSSQAGWAWQTKAAVSETGKEGGGKKLCAGSFRSVAWIFQLAKVEDPDIVVIMPSSSKGGILEKYIKVISSQVQLSIVYIKNLESSRVTLSSLTDQVIIGTLVSIVDIISLISIHGKVHQGLLYAKSLGLW